MLQTDGQATAYSERERDTLKIRGFGKYSLLECRLFVTYELPSRLLKSTDSDL